MQRFVKFLCAFAMAASVAEPLAAAVPDPEKGADPAKAPWRDQETLHYEVDFAMLTAAKGVFKIRRQKGYDEMKLFLTTDGIAEALYPIRSLFWSHMSLQPWRNLEYGEKRDENGDINHEKNTVDYAAGKVTRERYSDKRTDTFTFKKKRKLSDLVSMNYGLRYGSWKVGDKRHFYLHEGGKIKEGTAECMSIQDQSVAGWPKQRMIELHCEPIGADQGKGALDLYLTDDKWRLPLLARLQFYYGTADIRLVKAEAPGRKTREVPK